MKRLLLLRHAKASRDLPAGKDADRPLTRRGRDDAAAIGRYLHGQRRKPSLVLCSTAVRTRETLDILMEHLPIRPAVQFLSELYLAEAETILSFVRHARDGAATLMVVGHNPGLEICAQRLIRPPKDEDTCLRLAAMAEKFPTCALAAIDFAAARWSDVAFDEGALRLFVRGRDFL